MIQASIYVTSIDCELKGKAQKQIKNTASSGVRQSSHLAIASFTKMTEQIKNMLLTSPAGVDGEDPTRTTIHQFATVVVVATPKPRDPEPEAPVKKGDKKEAADDDDDDDGGGSVESASTKKSDKPKEGSKNGSQAGSKAGSKTSKRSASVYSIHNKHATT